MLVGSVAMTPDEIVEILGLEPHHEGGFFRESHRDALVIPGGALPHLPGDRACSTHIYYLLRDGAVSALHRVRSTEVFHHYLGDPVTQLQIGADGAARVAAIGPDLAAGQRPQVVVPAGAWQGAMLARGGPSSFALLGCTVAPGFEWEDFELADGVTCDALAAAHPEHAGLIGALRPG